MPMEPVIFYGALPIVSGEVREVIGGPGELDSVRFNITATRSNWSDELLQNGFAAQQMVLPTYGYHSMWVNSMERTYTSEQTVEIAVNCLGLISGGEKRKTKFIGRLRRHSIGPDESRPGPLRNSDGDYVMQSVGSGWYVYDGEVVPRERYPKIIIDDGAVGPDAALSVGMKSLSVSTTYFATVRPSTAAVGRAGTPPVERLDDASITIQAEFAFLRKNLPSGWVLDSREVEELFSSGYISGSEGVGGSGGLFYVSDVYTYYPPMEPA